MNISSATWRIAALSCAILVAGELRAQEIEEIVVTGVLRERAASEVPTSITVLDSEAIQQLAVQHFEELVNAIPNLNWSGDGHRARYFQIRGVGELEQYEGAPNPSVGFLIDDIDFSGIGTVATLFDMQQVEVLRGPQGSRYGANALAGLVYMRSAAPSAVWNGRLQLSIADDDALSVGAAVGGPLTADKRWLFRVSAHQHESDGYRDNAFLGRDDTNARDESSFRGRLRWLPNERWQVDVAAMYADIDNGYDGFALDSGFTMLSDKPGKDAQQSAGASLRVGFEAANGVKVTSITTAADSDIVFSYDADWGNPDSWAPFVYDFISFNDRQRQTLSQEIRVERADWLVGAYVMQLEDELLTINQGDYYDPVFDFSFALDESLASHYESTNVALFGHYERELGTATRLGVGIRAERRTTDYRDSGGLVAGPSESISGGELTLGHDYSDTVAAYVSLSKGYKAGGFNLGFVPAGRRNFGAEDLWNFEVGVKSRWFDERLDFNAAAFFSRRDDQQVRTSFQLVPGDPASFVFFTDNAAKGEIRGVEADLSWAPNAAWLLYASIGVLDARFDEFVTPQVDLGGRAQAHAPHYTFAFGGRYSHPSGVFARLDASARDEFFFDVSHDQKSHAYELVNARIGYESGHWLAQFWVRNLFREDYAVRGFFFGNEPPDFPNTLYTRPGDPRQIGITVDWRF